jgi:hypothetical protein
MPYHDFYCTFVPRQRLGKHVPAETDKHATIEVLMETVFSIRLVQGGHKEESLCKRISSVREYVKRTLSCEAEESVLLEGVATEWLMKIEQIGNGLAGAVMIYELSRLAAALHRLIRMTSTQLLGISEGLVYMNS